MTETKRNSATSAPLGSQASELHLSGDAFGQVRWQHANMQTDDWTAGRSSKIGAFSVV